MIGPGGLLLLVSLLFDVQVSLLPVGLQKSIDALKPLKFVGLLAFTKVQV